jgi:Flp pilus assembly pilin Flp
MEIKTKLLGQRGASLVEYSMVVAIVAVVCIGGVTDLRHSVAAGFCEVIGKGLDSNAYTTYVINPTTGKGTCRPSQFGGFGQTPYF